MVCRLACAYIYICTYIYVYVGACIYMNIYQNTHTNSDMGLLPYRCAATRVFCAGRDLYCWVACTHKSCLTGPVCILIGFLCIRVCTCAFCVQKALCWAVSVTET